MAEHFMVSYPGVSQRSYPKLEGAADTAGERGNGGAAALPAIGELANKTQPQRVREGGEDAGLLLFAYRAFEHAFQYIRALLYIQVLI